MPKDPSSSDEPLHKTRPLSRRATRALIIAGLLVTFLIALASSWFLVESARESSPGAPPADTLREDQRSDSLASPSADSVSE